MTKSDKIGLWLLGALVAGILLEIAILVSISVNDGKVTNYCDTGKQNRIYVYEDKFQVVYDPTCETE